MKNVSFIILGTSAVVLMGLAMWQLMWMSDVVNKYDSNRSYKMTDLKNNIKDGKFQDKGTNGVIADKPAEEKTETIHDNPRVNLEKEEQVSVVPERSSTLDSKKVKSISAKEQPSASSKKSDRGRKNITPLSDENESIRDDKSTVSIRLTGSKPLPIRPQVISETPVSPGKPLNIPIQSATQHATSTSPY